MYSYEDFLLKKLNYGKELYEHESKVRQQTSGKFAITITIYTAIITAWITLFSSVVKSVNTEALSLPAIVLVIILLSIIILVIISIVHFLCCFMNYKERTIEPSQVSKLFDDSESLFGQYESDEIISNIDNIMANSYMQCAIHNFNQTTKKIKSLNNAYIFMLISIVDLFVAFLFSLLL